MPKFALIAALAACFGLAAAAVPGGSALAAGLSVEPTVFTARDGTKVDAERGSFEVPENRANPASRKIKLSFVRFRSTSRTPGDPIVYLAGGPGGSGAGTAEGPRFPLFMKLREISDVIAFDQRGTGGSNMIPPCKSEGAPAPDALTRSNLIAFYRREIARCFDWWEKQGVDIDGYTTKQSAHDIEDLRQALGARAINLWGISYGSHLGLAVMKYHPQSVSRAVFAGIEGLDQTVKRPALTDEVFARLQAIIDADPKTKALYPDLAATMRRVHARLDAQPARVTFTPKGASAPVTVVFDGYLVQMLTAFSIADPSGFARVPITYLALEHGQYEPIAQALYGLTQQEFAGFRGMPEAMDLASGISPKRLALVRDEAKTALLGDALNFPMPHILGIRPQIDLGEDFRAPLKSAVPTLFISGTLDGRTYPAEAKAEMEGLSNGAHLIVENGGHNIFEADTRIADAVFAFFQGKTAPRLIRFEPPRIATP